MVCDSWTEQRMTAGYRQLHMLSSSSCRGQVAAAAAGESQFEQLRPCSSWHFSHPWHCKHSPAGQMLPAWLGTVFNSAFEHLKKQISRVERMSRVHAFAQKSCHFFAQQINLESFACTFSEWVCRIPPYGPYNRHNLKGTEEK